MQNELEQIKREAQRIISFVEDRDVSIELEYRVRVAAARIEDLANKIQEMR